MHRKSYLHLFWPVYLITTLCFIAAAIGMNRAATTFGENTPISRETTIVIDAGHGGEDGGAISCTGVLESSINLEIAIRLNELLKLLGYKTIMIRTTDISVYTEGKTIAQKKISDLKQRVSIVGSYHNPLLISIHQNTFVDPRYNGAQVFYASGKGSKALADNLQTALISACNHDSNRKAKEAEGVYLMQHITCPGILVECGFLSNAEEEARLRSDLYQKQLCCVIAATTGNYLSAMA